MIINEVLVTSKKQMKNDLIMSLMKDESVKSNNLPVVFSCK